MSDGDLSDLVLRIMLNTWTVSDMETIERMEAELAVLRGQRERLSIYWRDAVQWAHVWKRIAKKLWGTGPRCAWCGEHLPAVPRATSGEDLYLLALTVIARSVQGAPSRRHYGWLSRRVLGRIAQEALDNGQGRGG